MATLFAAAIILAATTGEQALQGPCAPVPRDGVIRTPGRYCLSGERVATLPIGIDVAAADVTLELRGAVLRPSRRSPNTVGVSAREAGRRLRIVGGTIDGFAIGITQAAGEGLQAEQVTLRNIGAIGIRSTGNTSRFRDNIIESVGGQPLDPANAYSIAANLTGRDVIFERNTIRDVRRQDFPPATVGEAVGILIGDDCADCLVAGNTVGKLTPEAESIGIWNSSMGKTEIKNNAIKGFDQGLITLGRRYAVFSNQIACAGGPTTTGVLMSLGRSGADGEGAVFDNRFTACSIEQLMCDNGCKAPWIMDLIQRLRRPPAVKPR